MTHESRAAGSKLGAPTGKRGAGGFQARSHLRSSLLGDAARSGSRWRRRIQGFARGSLMVKCLGLLYRKPCAVTPRQTPLIQHHSEGETRVPKTVDYCIESAQTDPVCQTEDEVMTRAKRVALYARVSTDHQTAENQLAELRAWAERAGYVVIGEYVDQAVSGAKGRNGRPRFDALRKAAVRREFDVMAAWSVDRLGRSLQDLVEFLNEIHAHRVDLYLHQQGMDTTTPSGKALFQMCGVFAEFERAMIVERVNAGLARARAQGKRLGRPRVSGQIEAQVRARRRKGYGMIRIARELGIGVGTVQRIVGEEARRA